MYKSCRNYENLQHAIYDGVGPYGMPQMDPVQLDASAVNWIGFNYARGCEDPEVHGVHFFLDDYQFQRVWTQADTYTQMLSKFQAVLSPDFSMYVDFPLAIQLYNSYRKHWLARYWQDAGLTVIPTVGWSTPDSFAWCFDGDPVGGLVAVSSVGTQMDLIGKDLFLSGYQEMQRRLQPSQVLFYGPVPSEIDPASVIQIQPFYRQLKARCKAKENETGQK